MTNSSHSPTLPLSHSRTLFLFLALLTISASAQPLPWEPPPRTTEPILRLPSNPTELLERFDIGPTQLASLVDNQPITPSEHDLVLKILHRLPRLGRENLVRWRKADFPWDQLVAAPNDHRAQVFHLTGRALRAEKQSLPPDQAELYEFSHYFLVTLALDRAPHQALVFTRRIPAAWPLDQPLDEPASADALFLKLGDSQLAFATPALAWHPDQLSPSYHIGPDQLALSKLGLDLSLWDDVRHTNDQPLTAADREGFYQLLAALSQPDASQLRSQTKDSLDVVPLLKNPADHFGQILPVQGIARRALKVAVTDSDIQTRFGIKHYYEIDLFVPLVGPTLQFEGDQKNAAKAVYENTFPATLIVPALPAGLPEGENLHELIRADGVFFKIWTFRSGYTNRVGQLQRAPLFLSANARVVPAAPTANWVTSSLVLVALGLTLGIAAVIAWAYGREDRLGRKKIAGRTKDISPPDFSRLT
jgi:hypothetical protein